MAENGEIATVQMGQRFAAYERVMRGNGWLKDDGNAVEDSVPTEAAAREIADVGAIHSAADLAAVFDRRLSAACPSKLPHKIGFDFEDAGEVHVDGTGAVVRAHPYAADNADTIVLGL